MKSWLVIVSTSVVAGLFLVTLGFLETATPHRQKDTSHQANPSIATTAARRLLAPAKQPAVIVSSSDRRTDTQPVLQGHPKLEELTNKNLAGDWKASQPPLDKWSKSEGRIVGTFEFSDSYDATLLHLTIFDEVYYDSNSVDLTINLKMSKFDEATSTFTLRCSEGDEYFAWAEFTMKALQKKEQNYFDFDMKLVFRDTNTKAPFNMRQISPDRKSLLVEFYFKSQSLGFTLSGVMTTADPHRTNTWLYWSVLLLTFIILLLSFSGVPSISEDFIPNVGPEVVSLISLYNFHLFVAYLQLSKVNQHYVFFSYMMSFLSLGQSFAMLMISIYFLARSDMYHRNMFANNQEMIRQQERYVGLFVLSYLAILFVLALYSPSVIFKSFYKYILYLVFSFPLLQVILTYRRFVNRKVFSPHFHLVTWWTPLYPLMLWKGIPNELVNMSPDKSLAIYAGCCLVFGTLFMFLQSKFGLYFYMPSDWIPGNFNLKRKVSRVPKEKLEEVCSICYSKLKYDVSAPNDMVELLEESLEDSQILPHAEEIFVTPCDHYFHVNCLLTWLTTKKQTCPLCNRPVHYIE